MQISSTYHHTTIGSVFLVGAGPGDPELLTLKAYRLIQQADVILYDYLVSEGIKAMFPKTTEQVYVGKKCGEHSMSQAQICQTIAKYALQGKQVVRLKGGDPSIFGRVAEEILHMQSLNIPVAVVPGITAASGCAAYSGIPLTHRDCAHGVRLLTAHFKEPDQEAHWHDLAQGSDTLVFYMGATRLDRIAQALIEHGKASDTPMAIIEQGTSEQQKTHITRLDKVIEQPRDTSFSGPVLIIIGEVVNHRTVMDTSLLNASAQTWVTA